MVANGLGVLRFTNEEVLNNTEAVLRRAAEFLVGANVDAPSNEQKLNSPWGPPSPPKGRGIQNKNQFAL